MAFTRSPSLNNNLKILNNSLTFIVPTNRCALNLIFSGMGWSSSPSFARSSSESSGRTTLRSSDHTCLRLEAKYFQNCPLSQRKQPILPTITGHFCTTYPNKNSTVTISDYVWKWSLWEFCKDTNVRRNNHKGQPSSSHSGANRSRARRNNSYMIDVLP